jgi:ubiquinone/menaquinone biosynthesis C-methylase UbiE
MLYRVSAATVVVLLAIITAGGGDWTGFGFRAEGREMPRLARVLALKPGMVIADVGAGKGELTIALAREVGPAGRVFSTDIDPQRAERVRALAAGANLANVTVVTGDARESSLPPNCCDAIVMRRVFHHLSDPLSTSASLREALRPGSTFAVIDFPPPLFSRHGVEAQTVIDAVTSSGREFVALIDDWPGRGPLASYCVIFRKPVAAAS